MNIYDKSGNVLLAVSLTPACEHTEELMRTDEVKLSWNSDSNTPLPDGAYVQLTNGGEKYSLTAPYTPTQKKEGAWLYEPVFVSGFYGLAKVPFYMYTYDGAEITNREADWTLTDTPSNFMRAVCIGIENETGVKYTFAVDSGLDASKTVEFSSLDIISALGKIANAFETEYWLEKFANADSSGNIGRIHLSMAKSGTAKTLSVGTNINVPSVTEGGDGFFNRFVVFGSTRNITQDYLGAGVNSIARKRLTLSPDDYPNGYIDFSGSNKPSTKILVFDDIFPSSNLRIKAVLARIRYVLDDNDQRIEIQPGVYDQYAIYYVKLEEYVGGSWVDFAFNNTDYDPETNPTGMRLPNLAVSVRFDSGPLRGREFELKYLDNALTNVKDKADAAPFSCPSGYFEIVKMQEGDYIIPSLSGLVPGETDEVVLFNVKAPQGNIASAQERLRDAAIDEIRRRYLKLDENGDAITDASGNLVRTDLNSYQFSSNPVAFNSSNPNLKIGSKVNYVNGDYVLETRVRSIVTRLDTPVRQTITIGEELIKGTIQELKDDAANANQNIDLLDALAASTQRLLDAYNRTQELIQARQVDTFFEINALRSTRIDLREAYSFLGPRKGLIFDAQTSRIESDPPDLYVRTIDGQRVLYSPLPLITEGDQIVSPGTPGGGGGGSVGFLADLEDVSDALYSPSPGMLLQYDATQRLWVGNAPASQIGVGVTGFTTGGLIRSVLGDDFDSTWTVKQFINSSVATATATFRGTNTTATTEAAFLTWANGLTHDLNDYVFWKTADSLGNVVYKRYKYDGSQWVFEYELNNSSFTSQQWDAINSGITSGKVGTYDTIAGYFSGGKILSTALPAMYIGKTAVQFTSATQDLTGIGNVTLDNAKYLRAYNSAGDTLYNLAGLTSSNYGYFGAANSPRTYMRGQSLYFLSGDSGNTSALVISTTQNATFYGSIYLQNGKQIYGKSTADTGGVSLSLLNLSASNVLLIGSGLIATGTSARAYNTYIYGASVSFYTGNSTNGSSRKWMINSSGNLYPYADKSYNLGAAANYIKEAYIGKMFLAPGVYIEYVPASGDTPGYVHISSHLLTDGDQIVKEGVPGGGGGGGSEYLWELEDVDNALITPSNGVVLQYNATAEKWVGVASDTIGITTAGTVAELNAANPTTAKRVWSPSVLASWLAGKGFLTSAVTNVAVGGSGHTDELAITKGGTTSYLTVPYATNVVRFKRYDGTLNVEGGYDLNTLLAGGGITSQYNSVHTWGNAPTDMSYGGAVQLNPRDSSQLLAMQLAWDIDHTNVKTGHLWWRDSIYKNSTHTWGEWHLIYDDTTLTKSVITGLLDAGNGTYVKLNPGSAEQTISSNISSLDKGVVNLWRKSGDHYAFLGFSNGTTETYLGGIGFKSQSDHNLYRKDGSNYYKIWDEANSNLASVNWACKNLSVAGNITLANNKLIRWMSNPAAGASPEAITAIEFTTGNDLYIGYGVAVSGHYTRLYGNTIYFMTGSSTRTTAFLLSDSDAKMYRTFVPSINNRYDLGSSELKWGTLHANNGNFYNKVNVGGPSSTPAAVNVAGTIWASTGIWSDGYVSAGGVSSSSDKRLKKNIADFKYSKELLMGLKPREWDWDEDKSRMRGHAAGFIAQEVEKMLPYAVRDGRDYKQMIYNTFFAVALSGLQNHEERISALEADNEKYKRENKQLKDENTELRRMLNSN